MVIAMFYRDQAPAHFHAVYGDYEITVAIETGVVTGRFPNLRFADGTEGDVDLRQELEGEVFERLKDRAFFQAFTVSPELHTVVWPNGADFAPEFLYEKVQILA